MGAGQRDSGCGATSVAGGAGQAGPLPHVPAPDSEALTSEGEGPGSWTKDQRARGAPSPAIVTSQPPANARVLPLPLPLMRSQPAGPHPGVTRWDSAQTALGQPRRVLGRVPTLLQGPLKPPPVPAARGAPPREAQARRAQVPSSAPRTAWALGGERRPLCTVDAGGRPRAERGHTRTRPPLHADGGAEPTSPQALPLRPVTGPQVQRQWLPEPTEAWGYETPSAGHSSAGAGGQPARAPPRGGHSGARGTPRASSTRGRAPAPDSPPPPQCQQSKRVPGVLAEPRPVPPSPAQLLLSCSPANRGGARWRPETPAFCLHSPTPQAPSRRPELPGVAQPRHCGRAPAPTATAPAPQGLGFGHGEPGSPLQAVLAPLFNKDLFMHSAE
ncbi:uncharacterized protein [Oryctolagus cuniculus]|uniref:uncharacterized protein n=1 Tax=Oryctolagus cuniculus TaxID=9986 RepID=UPI003879CC58